MKNFITSVVLLFTISLFAQVPPAEYGTEDSGSRYGTGNGSGTGYDAGYDAGPGEHDLMISDPGDGPVSVEAGGTRSNRITIYYGDNKKKGLKSSDGKVALIPNYDDIQFTDYGFLIRQGAKYGALTKTVTPILPVEYDSIYTDSYTRGNNIKAKKKDKWGVFAEDGKTLLPVKFYKILYSDSGTGFSLVQKNKGDAPEGYFGDKKFGRPLQRVIIYLNGVVATSGGKQGFLKDGKEILPFEYDSIATNAYKFRPKQIVMLYRTQLTNLTVTKNGKFGLANLSGRVFLQPVYDKITYMPDKKLYILIKDKKYGVHFEETGFYLEAAYDMVSPEGSRYVIVTKDKKKGLFINMGNWVIPLEDGYDNITIKGKGFTLLKDKKNGLADGNGIITVPVIYDENEEISYTTSRYYRAKLNGKYGFIDDKNTVIVPAEYDALFLSYDFVTGIKDKQFYIFNEKGLPVGGPYDKIRSSETQRSNLIFAQKNGLWSIISNTARGVIFETQFKEINYLYDQDLLISSLNNGKAHLVVKDKNNKYGIFEEYKGEMAIPAVYDGIYQKTYAVAQTYFVAKKDKKFGVIDGFNRVTVPFEYDSINFNNARLINDEAQIVAVKNKKFGVINLSNQVVVPFEYKEVVKISVTNLYKAKKKDTWMLIDGANKVLNAGPFDEIAQFEGDNALTFYKGQMRVINNLGVLTTQPVAMQPHNGYKTFDELKYALVTALDSPDDALLKIFADKAAPSGQTFYFLKRNIFNREPLYSPDVDGIRQRYFEALLNFKRSAKNSTYSEYKKGDITNVQDHTLLSDGFVTVKRSTEWDYGGRFMELILRNAVKINGYWISTYFMTRQFNNR